MFGRTKQEEDLFFKALGRPDPEARCAFLTRVCAGEPALYARVEKLLAVQGQVEEFFAEAERATYI